MGRSVSVKLLADVASFTRNVGGTAVGAVKSLSGELDKAAQAGKLDKTIKGTAALGLGLIGVAGAAIKMNMDFEKAMSAVSAATHAPQAELDKLRQAAIRAGQDTQYSATEAADGITELAKAGVSTTDILNGGLKGALSLAAAGQLSVAEAAQTSASALTQFRLQGSAVPHVADLLAAAAGKAQGSVHDMGYALNQSGLVASQFGLSVEDTTGVLAEFASAGLIGSDAGTSFKTMLLAMANPSQITKRLMDSLNISFYDTQGKFIGLSGVAQVLQSRLGDLTEEQRNAALGQIFGNDAIRSATVLYKDGAQGVTDWKNKVNDSGYAAVTAAKLTDNLSGDLERLKGSLETVAIQSGGGATNGLRKLAQGANGAVNAFSALPGWVQESVTVLSGVGGVSLLAAAGFLKARGTAKDFINELREMGPMGASTADKLGKIGSVAGKLGLVGAAAIGVYSGMKLFGDWIEHFADPTKRDIDKMTDALGQFADQGKATGELSKTFGADLQGLARDLDAVQKSQDRLNSLKSIGSSAAGKEGQGRAEAALSGSIKDQAAQAKTDIAALDQALANLVQNGNATAAKIAFNQFAKSTGLSLTDLTLYPAAAKNAGTANSGLAQGFGDTAANANTMTDSLQSAIEAGQKLTDVWNQLHGATLSADETALNAKKAIDAVKDSFKENGKAIQGNTTKALANRVAIGEAAKQAAVAAQAKYEETQSVTDANKVYDTYIGQLRKTLIHAGLNKTEVDKLIGAYAKMPPTIATNIKQPGMEDAISRTKTLWDKLKGVDGNWVARLSMPGYAGVKGQLLDLMTAQYQLENPNASKNAISEDRREKSRFLMATGGPVRGPGSGTSDSIPAWLSNGEHVWTAAEVAALGGQQAMLTLRAAIRSGRRVDYGDAAPGFATGGAVFPMRADVGGTKIPKPNYSAPGGAGGPGYKWMEQAVHTAFPGMAVYSDYRPGAITITGNRSYHAFGRAVDFAPSKPLAEWINLHYMKATKELITPWQSLNIHNGGRHAYSALVENEHNFAGGNAHDHWAMANGGVIREPVFGVGLRSGDTYSLGERGIETVTPGGPPAGAGSTTINLTVTAPVGSHPAEIGAQVVQSIGAYLGRGGSLVVRGRTVLSA